MARIVGVDLPTEKRVDIGLTAIYGIGRSNVGGVLKKAKIDAAKRVKNLTNEETNRLQEAVEGIITEGFLRQKIYEDIKRMKAIGCYRGVRHAQNLPVRGQRTRSNARTKRGKRMTIGALKKKDSAKFGTASKEKESKSNE